MRHTISELETDYGGDSYRVDVSLSEEAILALLNKKGITFNSVRVALLPTIMGKISFDIKISDISDIEYKNESDLLEMIETRIANIIRERLSIAVGKITYPIINTQRLYHLLFSLVDYTAPISAGFTWPFIYRLPIALGWKIYFIILTLFTAKYLKDTIHQFIEDIIVSSLTKVQFSEPTSDELKRYKTEIHEAKFFSLYQEAVQIKITKKEK